MYTLLSSIDGVVWFHWFVMTDKPLNEGLLLQCIGELNSKWTYYSTFSQMLSVFAAQGQRNMPLICCLKLVDETVIWEGLIAAMTARYRKSPLNP